MGYNTGSINDSEAGGIAALKASHTDGYAGGFVGQNSGAISGCTVTDIGALSGSNYVGGFVGTNSGTIQKSYTTVSVKGTSHVGGFTGQINGGKIEQCYATGTVDGTSHLGGFAGSISVSGSVIRNSFSHGNVAAGSYSAGFVGQIASGTVENCYSTAHSPNGFHYNGKVTSSYYDSSISGNTEKAEGRSSADMKKADTYVGWDFGSIWEIEDGYPTLQGLAAPGSSLGEYTEAYSD